jgi:hypothetical protein
MRYLITHDPRCACAVRTPYVCETPREVALYLCGRDVTYYTVYDGECPYVFTLGDLASIEDALRLFPASVVRGYLPLTISVRDGHGYYFTTVAGRGDTHICTIGK